MKNTSLYLLTILLFTSACGGEKKAETLDPKAAHELAAKELSEWVGLISAYLPYLDIPKPDKYAPPKRPDLKKTSYFAANEIRHAANGARQRNRRSKSSVSVGLIPTFEQLTKVCASPDDKSDVEKCKAAVAKLNDALKAVAATGKAAGMSGTIPLVGPDAITDATRKALEPFRKAIGPTETEKKYLKQRAKEDITAGALIGICRTAASEADATMNELERAGDEDIRKLAAHHKIAVDAQCNRLEGQDRLLNTVKACKKTDADNEVECKLACSKAKVQLDDGVLAAAFAKLQSHYDEACKEDDKK